MKITYLDRGRVVDYKRIGDRAVTVNLFNVFKSGGLIYGYRDRFNVVSIAAEDIISMEE